MGKGMTMGDWTEHPDEKVMTCPDCQGKGWRELLGPACDTCEGRGNVPVVEDDEPYWVWAGYDNERNAQ